MRGQTKFYFETSFLTDQTFWPISPNPTSGTYPSSFTNVCFSTKIEFSNVLKYRWGFQGAARSAKSSHWSPSGGSGG